MLGRLREKLPSLSCLHADHHYLGRYSIEKLHLFEQYQRVASPLRVAAVLLFTPMPTFLILTALDLASLDDPRAGASQNTVAFVRSAVSHAVMTFFTLLPLKQALSLNDRDYSFLTIAVIACCTSLTIEAVCIPLAFTWRFPVPFREMIGFPVFLASVCVHNWIFAKNTMRRLWRQRRLQLYVPIVGVQVNLFYLFLGVSVGFAYLPLALQTVMILIFPFVKILLKQLVWKYARTLDDISTDVTICMLEVSGSLYQTVCMQFVTSPVLNVLIVLTDFIQAAHEVRTYVGVDYLGDGRHTMETALKIVESSLFDAAEKRTSRSTAPTQSTGTTTDYADVDSSVYEGTRDSEDLTTTFSRRSTLRRIRRSSAESMSIATLADDQEAEGRGSETEETTQTAERRIEIQGKSVVMPIQALRERTASGKRRRRLLDLDLMRVEASDGRSASQGRISQNEMVENNDLPVVPPHEEQAPIAPKRKVELPAVIVRRCNSATTFRTQVPLGKSTKSPRPSALDDQAAHSTMTHPSGTELTMPPEEPPVQRKSAALPRITRHSSDRLRTVSVSAQTQEGPELSDLTSETGVQAKSLQRSSSAKLRIRASQYQVVPVDSLHQQQPQLATDVPTHYQSRTSSHGPKPVTPDLPTQSRRLVRRPTKPVSIDGIRIPRRDQARILEQTLQLLFASEVLLFVEYMEVVIPVLYALVIGSEWVLPNGKYNIVVMGMNSSSVAGQLEMAMGFALLELVSMLAMYWVMRRKYGVSAMYQLAFVLERYWMTLQGKLVGSFIVVLNAVTVHQGTDFSFLFASGT